MIIPGYRFVPSHTLQMPLHAVCTHPVHIVGLAFILERQASKHKQHGAVLADAVACAYPAPVVHQRGRPVLLSDALGIVCLAPVLHVVAHLYVPHCIC